MERLEALKDVIRVERRGRVEEARPDTILRYGC